MLEPHLQQLRHLASSTEQVQSRLQGITCGPKTVLVKLGVAQFFLSGSHDTVVAATGEAFQGTMRQMVQDLLWLLLSSQFLLDPDSRADWLWSTWKGSEIGAKHSPHVANLCFHQLVEGTLLANLERFGVVKNIRLFDDTFAVVATHERALEFFSLELDAVSR